MFARRLFAGVAALGFLLSACSAGSVGPASSEGAAASSPSSIPASSAPASDVADLPDLGLSNVQTETANAREATIGAAGGTVSATGSDGAVFTLVVPPRALDTATQVAVYPVSSIVGLPQGGALSDGVQFAPDGTHLLAPATLTIALPVGADTAKLGALSWSADAKAVERAPVEFSGGTATLRIYHFSGGGVGPVPLVPISSCLTEADMAEQIGQDVALASSHDPDARRVFTQDLKACWSDYVSPLMTVASKESAFDNLDEEHAAVDAYQLWRDFAIYWAQGFFPGFTVSPEMADSQALAAKLLRNWFDTIDLECIGLADQPHRALLAATLALDTPHEKAVEWGIDTTANKLDYGSLLDDLCVQVVIDPSRTFSGSKPGDSGTVTVPVGYSVAGQPALHDEPIDVKLTSAGETSPFADADAPSDGTFTATLTWPDGVDPLKIDVLASLDFGGNLSEIARFDEITKSSGKQVTVTAPTGAWSGERWPIVWSTCIRQFLAVDEGEDWTFSVSGASIFATAGDSVTFIGSEEGVVSVSGHSPTSGAATYSGYMSPLAGTYSNADRSLRIDVHGQLDQEGILTWTVRPMAGIVAPDWTGLAANDGELSGTNSGGQALDITIRGGQLTGTVDGQQVSLPKECQ